MRKTEKQAGKEGHRYSYEEIAEKINILSAFRGPRDLTGLSEDALHDKYGITQADILILFGASIPAAYALCEQAVRNNLSRYYMLVGGIGHTTGTLQNLMQPYLTDFDTSGMPEADIMYHYIRNQVNLSDMELIIENKSTNCGNNVTNALALFPDDKIRNVIIMQDSTMQRRICAGFEKYAPQLTIINYAGYGIKVVHDHDTLGFNQELWGMWNMERYISLLLGEIARLYDDENGYGPNGKGYIAHVTIPPAVLEAYCALLGIYGTDTVREANPLYQ